MAKKKWEEEYTPGADVLAARKTADNALNAYSQAVDRLRQGTEYGDAYKRALNAYTNRAPFEYDMTNDALYNQYKNQYVNLGKQAAQNVAAEAANLTGGYGNSYGTVASNQAYQAYLGKLNDMVPTLYGLAQDRYNAEGNRLLQNAQLYGDADDRAYNRLNNDAALLGQLYGIAQDRYNNDRNFGYNAYTDNRTFNYGVDRDNISDAQWREQMDYQKGRDKVEDERWERQFNYQKDQDAKSYALSLAKAAGSGSGRSGSGYDTPTALDVNAQQKISDYIEKNVVKADGTIDQNDLMNYLSYNGLLDTPLGDVIMNRYFPDADIDKTAKVQSKKAPTSGRYYALDPVTGYESSMVKRIKKKR